MVDNLLPLLDNRDLATLRRVSKHAKSLAEDEVLWKRKVLNDFTFPLTPLPAWVDGLTSIQPQQP